MMTSEHLDKYNNLMEEYLPLPRSFFIIGPNVENTILDKKC